VERYPVALTIAGSDSGGGAGIQADLKTFAALRVHGASAITCLTAQNPKGVTGIQPVRTDMVQKQIEAVLSELPPRAVKTGMLYSADIIKTVAQFFRLPKGPALVVDPVMVATSGAVLLQPSAIRALSTHLLPQARLITPNLDETELLVGRKLVSLEDLLEAALELNQQFGCAALVKGGHLKLGRNAVDVLFDGKKFTVLKAVRFKGVSTHGTGCTYSAAIAAYLARGEKLDHAVARAKQFITRSIKCSYLAARHPVLNQFHPRG